MGDPELRKIWGPTIPLEVDWDTLSPNRTYRPEAFDHDSQTVATASGIGPPGGAPKLGDSERSQLGEAVARNDPAGVSSAPTVLSVDSKDLRSDRAELPTQDLSTPDGEGADRDNGAEATRDIPPSRATLEATAGTTGYELLDQIGRGGMGLIHRAYQRCLEREVAVKRIRKRRDGSASVREQFVFEALTTGYLDHPNIVPVHELGRAESGELFMAMKLVEGVSWAALLEPRNEAQRELAQKYQPEDHLELLITVGHALAFAHSRGIVHRDLKPENVMIGPFGEVLVMDWGIALDFRDEPDPPCRAPHCSTARGPAGTPSYMAPEQAEGRGECIGPPTDIYQLGAILHELLTGKPPHRGASVYAALLSATRAARPELPSEVPEELAAVCRRALEKEPGDRYPDVAAMQEALRTYLRHTESHTIARSALETLAQCEEQASALVGSFTSSVSLAPRTEAEEDAQDAETSRPQGLYARFAEAVAGFHQSQLLWPGNPDAARGERRARLAFAEAARRAGDFGLAAAQLEALPTDDRDASVLRAKVEAARLAREENERRERRLRRGFYITALLLMAALSIGFALVKAAERRTAHERDEARAARASAEISEWHARLEAARNLYDRSFRFTDDNRIGEAMACLLRAVEIAPPGAAPEEFPTAWDQPGWAEASWLRLRLLDHRRARATDVLDHGDWVRALATSDGLGLVLTGSDDGDIRVVDVTPSEDGQADDPVRYRLEGPGGFVYALAIGPGSVHFAAGTGDGLVRVWRRAARRSEEGRPREVAPRLVATVKLSSNAVRALGFLPDDTLVAGLDDGTLRFVDISAGRELAERRLTAHPGGVRALTIRDHQVISGGADQTALQLDTTTGETRRLTGHTGWVTSVAIAPEGLLVATASYDQSVRLTDLTTGNLIRRIDRSGARITSVAIDPTGQLLLVGSADGLAHVYSLETGAAERRLDVGGEVLAVDFVDHGRTAVTTSSDGRLRRFDHAALLPEDEYSGHDLYVSDVAFVGASGERGGLQLLTGSGDGTLREVDRETGVERRIQLPAGLAVASFAAGEPGQPTLVITFDREAWVSEARLLRGGKMGEPIFRHDGRIVGGALLRGGAAAVGTEDGVLALLDTESGKATARFETPWEIGALARVPGEGAGPDRILLGLGNGQARVIDPSDGGTVVTLTGHDQEVWAVAVDALGRHALTGSGDGTVRLWDLQTGAELRRMSGHERAIVGVSFAGDGRLVASGSADRTARVWDAITGQELSRLIGHGSAVQAVALAPGGTHLLTGADDGRARLFRLISEGLPDALVTTDLGAALRPLYRRAGFEVVRDGPEAGQVRPLQPAGSKGRESPQRR